MALLSKCVSLFIQLWLQLPRVAVRWVLLATVSEGWVFHLNMEHISCIKLTLQIQMQKHVLCIYTSRLYHSLDITRWSSVGKFAYLKPHHQYSQCAPRSVVWKYLLNSRVEALSPVQVLRPRLFKRRLNCDNSTTEQTDILSIGVGFLLQEEWLVKDEFSTHSPIILFASFLLLAPSSARCLPQSYVAASKPLTCLHF